jgi:hypothetical protein
MLGTRNDRKLKTKGAETYGVLLFVVEQLRQFGDRAGEHHRRLLLAGESLEFMIRTWQNEPIRLTESVVKATPEELLQPVSPLVFQPEFGFSKL